MSLKTLFSISFFFLALTAISQPGIHGKGSLTIITEPGIASLSEAYISDNARHNSLIGYRVQVYNGRKAESQRIKTTFISRFPGTPVYHLYEAPEYKVQAGDFRTRLEAEKFLKRVIAEFGSGFVVKSRINLPVLSYPIKD